MPYGTHQAVPDARRGFEAVFGREPTWPELLFMLAVARYESAYGEAWAKRQPGCAGSFNLGAIHAGQLKPPCPPGTCPGFDTDSKGQKYPQCFKTYESREDAWRDYAHVLFRNSSDPRYNRDAVLRAAGRGDTRGAVLAMKASKYFGAPTARYLSAVRTNEAAIARILGESVPSSGRGLVPLAALVIVSAAAWARSRK